MPRAKKIVSKEISILSTPNWSSIKLDMQPIKGKDYDRLFADALYYVHYEVKSASLAKTFVSYCTKYFDKKKAATLKKLPDWRFDVIGKYTYLAAKGVELNDYHREEIEKEYNTMLSEVLPEVEEKPEEVKKKAPIISIQDRMREQVESLLSTWEQYIDNIFTGEEQDLKKLDLYREIQAYQPEVKAPHAKIILDEIMKLHGDYIQVKEFKDEDIKEEYAHLSATQRKAYFTLIEKIQIACDTVINTKKATRKTRKPKAASKEKMVAKLKYKDNEPSLGMASINPIEIFDCEQLWVYNIKNRKIGVYVADDMIKTLGVKGTTIVGFDPTKSVWKTVRKPEELLKGVGKLPRTKMKKLYDEIKTTETKMTGRINDQTILVKAF